MAKSHEEVREVIREAADWHSPRRSPSLERLARWISEEWPELLVRFDADSAVTVERRTPGRRYVNARWSTPSRHLRVEEPVPGGFPRRLLDFQSAEAHVHPKGYVCRWIRNRMDAE